MSLATLRAHVWKGGADVMLYYKSNGRKAIAYEKPAEPSQEDPPATQASA
jgi:WD repeat-containing protein 48